MALIVTDIRIGLEETERAAVEKALSKIRLKPSQVQKAYLIKSSVDARKKSEISLVCSVGIELSSIREEERLSQKYQLKQSREEALALPAGKQKISGPPVIAGFGPAGMFAALLLARAGFCPVVLERGGDVDARVLKVDGFWKKGELDSECNIQFGEGGAGTFSDGKLTTRINDPLCSYVLREFVIHGAPEEVLHRAKPHVGTDYLRSIVKSIRQEILALGGQIHFNTHLTDVKIQNGRLTSLSVVQGEIPAEMLILAVGHSARDTFAMLYEKGLLMEPKPFSVGVRIEQRQSVIDRGLYGAFAGHPALPKGEYQLSYRQNGRGVYTFCMCPGGMVVPSASEPGTVVTNGMSEYARDRENANAALVVSADSRDYGSRPLDGVAYQRRLEQKAFVLGGGSYRAPAQSAANFLAGKPGLGGASVRPSYALGVTDADFGGLFPPGILEMLRLGLLNFERRLPGFADPDVVMTGVETRTSSPVRIMRGETLEASGLQGIYPCGEGAGYAGGIMSAAVDGIKIALAIMGKYHA